MPRTPDMFAELKPPRKTPEKLMHVSDASGCCTDEGDGAMVRMQCKRCGHRNASGFTVSFAQAQAFEVLTHNAELTRRAKGTSGAAKRSES